MFVCVSCAVCWNKQKKSWPPWLTRQRVHSASLWLTGDIQEAQKRLLAPNVFSLFFSPSFLWLWTHHNTRTQRCPLFPDLHPRLSVPHAVAHMDSAFPANCAESCQVMRGLDHLKEIQHLNRNIQKHVEGESGAKNKHNHRTLLLSRTCLWCQRSSLF